jgi:hypothetical protein
MHRFGPLLFAVFLLQAATVGAQSPSKPAPLSVAAMMSIVHRTGENSHIAAELAKQLGIPIAANASQLAVKGRAYEEDKTTLTAFVSAQAGRDYLILIEQNDSGTVFILTNGAGEARKALMQTAANPSLQPLPPQLAEQFLKQRLAVWQQVLKQ